jgi:hypothetical protein
MNDKHRTDIYKSHLHMVTEEITSLLWLFFFASVG